MVALYMTVETECLRQRNNKAIKSLTFQSPTRCPIQWILQSMIYREYGQPPSHVVMEKASVSHVLFCITRVAPQDINMQEWRLISPTPSLYLMAMMQCILRLW